MGNPTPDSGKKGTQTMARKNMFKHTVADANRQVKSNAQKPAVKHPTQTVQEAARQAGMRVRIEETDSALDRGYKKSLAGGAFSTKRPPLQDKPATKRESPEQRLAKPEPPDVWDRIRWAGEEREEAQKAAFLKSKEPKGKK